MKPPKSTRIATATQYSHMGLHIYGVYEIQPDRVFAIHEGYWDWTSKWIPTPTELVQWIPRKELTLVRTPLKKRIHHPRRNDGHR